jgi:tetratricopeptide (TPR) repeat protein
VSTVSTPAQLLEEGRFFSDVGKLDAARQVLEEALAAGADPAETQALLALTAVRDSRWRTAEAHARAAEAAGFAEPWFERLRGRVAFRRGRRAEALAAYRRAAALAPEDIGALYDGLCAELAAGDDVATQALLDRMRRLDRAAAATVKATALVDLAGLRFEAARDELRGLVESTDVEALNNLAVALVACGETRAGRSVLRRALVAGERTSFWQDLQHNRRLLVGQTLRPLTEDPDADIPVLRRTGPKPFLIIGIPLVIALLLRDLISTNAVVAGALIGAVAVSIAAVLLLRPGEYHALPLQSGVTVHRPSVLARAARRHRTGG